MKKRTLLATSLVISGVSLIGCSVDSGNQNSVSDADVSTEISTSTPINDSSETNSLTETSETTTVEDSSVSNKEKATNSTEETTSSQKEDETAENEDQRESPQGTVPVRKYSEEEKEEASQEFLDWAVSRAEEGNMAVTDFFLGHGASGPGDWFAVTEDGEIQLQQHRTSEDLPGYDAYDIHALGGVVFYVSASDVTGYDEAPKEAATVEGFSEIVDADYPMHRYLLGDNGIVYELIASVDEIGSFSGSYGMYAEDGKKKEREPEFTFKVSDDVDAQKEWTHILEGY